MTKNTANSTQTRENNAGGAEVGLGRLESLLARFWPEVKGLLKLTSKTLWQALAEYGGTGALGEDPAAAERLARWSRRT